jgi:hypothetical protein
MNTNDQIFQIGDKVMRVMDKHEAESASGHSITVATKAGVVYCVTACWQGPACNLMRLAGCGHSAFSCFAFRRVSEIQLIIRASKRQPVETVETQNV